MKNSDRLLSKLKVDKDEHTFIHQYMFQKLVSIPPLKQ